MFLRSLKVYWFHVVLKTLIAVGEREEMVKTARAALWTTA
jgi:hypothetical protein